MAKKHYEDRNLKFETLQLHVGQEQPDPVTDARAVPIYLTSSYVFHNSEHAADRFGLRDAGNIYGRLTNPTEDVFERRIAALEGGVAALAVGSGAAALTYAFQAVAHAGDHIVAAKNIYGGTYNLLAHTLPDYGIEATFVDPFDYDGIKAAIKKNTKAIEIETLGNPNSEVVDIEKIANIAHEAGIPLIVDNTFATPYLVRPIEYGADIVVHSATKFIGGHGTTIGGVIIDSGKFDWTQNDKWPWLVEPNVSYHGVSFAKDCAPAAFATYIRAILLRDTGASQLSAGTQSLMNSVPTLTSGIKQLVDGSNTLVANNAQLNSGASQLADGTNQIVSGVDQLTTGSKTLSEGAHTLADGMVQFNEEGINKILDAYNGDLKPFTDKLQAVIDAGEEYQTYSAIADGQTGSVKFIYKLASIDAKADSDK